ncbi:hypothetical protein ACOTTU_19065 [Roseobacter sp. EG26]|uniref:hypothetical protein n=1 Tax=Roseobacter sp. EG26 TaxID=3412477 RepID=UPI003CE44CF8
MTSDDCVIVAKAELKMARQLIQDEIRDYPTPISGCDAQYNYLIGLRSSISDALSALEAPRFVATPRTPSPTAGVESR